MFALLADAFVWDELTFPSPSSHHSGIWWLLSSSFQLLAASAKLLYWRLFIRPLVIRLLGAHRRGFGRCLVAFAAVNICAVVFSLYFCLLPLRLSRWRATASSTSSELYWLLLHAVLGHVVLANIVVHFLAGVLCSPGHVPPLSPLPPHLPRTMCTRCLRPRPWRAHHCVVCGHHRINCLVHTVLCAIYRVAALVFVLVMGLLLWHGRLIGRGETSVEYHQNRRLARALSQHHLIFRNPFDFGPRVNWFRFLGLQISTDARVVERRRSYAGIETFVKRFILRSS